MKTLRQTFRIGLGLVWMMLVWAVMPANGQGIHSDYSIQLIGQLTNDVNGGPLKNHEVNIVSDTANESGFYYSNTVYTDKEGYYFDTIYTSRIKGALLIRTRDHLGNNYDTTLHYRFTWSDNNILFGDFVVTAPPQINYHQANFKFERNPSGNNKMEYKFTDLSSDMDVLYWTWDFGDSFHSQDQNPVHTYTEPGLYKVSLTVHYLGGHSDEALTSTFSKMVNVEIFSYYNMGGHVFAGYFPIDKSEVYLYQLVNGELVPIDTALFNEELGYYLFYQLIEGEYIIKADLHPESVLFNQFMPTYYSDEYHWYLAETIYHYSNNFEYDINLVPVVQSFSEGTGAIEGSICYDPGYGGNTSPAKNISIILFDEEEDVFSLCHSNNDGQFMLDELSIQKYTVYAEVTGLPTIPVEVVLESNANGIPEVHLVIDDECVSGAVNSGIEDNLTNAGIGMPYPNPSEQEIMLSIDDQSGETLHFEILNSSGQVLNSSSFTVSGTTVLQEDVSALQSGIYYIRLTDQHNRTAVRKFIKR